MHKKIFLLLLLPLNCVFAQKGEMNFIWYSKPATVFEDALPVGNGRIGGMVYGNKTCTVAPNKPLIINL
jgi:alpha-L-fucosidase 2